jgi:hypothetical protein
VGGNGIGPTTYRAGDGGAGSADIAGTVRAGGGAGQSAGGTNGTGGAGGGGNVNTAGTANYGGGGGAGSVAGSGGSGVVIIRYAGTTQIATGGNVTISGGYVYHTFTGTGTFAF